MFKAILYSFLFSWGLAAEPFPAANIFNIHNLQDRQILHASYGPLIFIFRVRPYDEVNKTFHAVRLTASDDDSIFQYMKDGASFEQIPFLRSGTALAGNDGEYEEIFPDPEANHYIFYIPGNRKESRASLLRPVGEHLLVSWTVQRIWRNKQSLPLSTMKGKDLHFVVMIDDNLNEIVDQGEYKRFTIVFD
jgi:hypothetical protein